MTTVEAVGVVVQVLAKRALLPVRPMAWRGRVGNNVDYLAIAKLKPTIIIRGKQPSGIIAPTKATTLSKCNSRQENSF